MTDQFAGQLRAQLDGIQAELERLATKRRLIEELLALESASSAPAPAAGPPTRRSARKTAKAARRRRRPRGLITGQVREFLAQQREPVHGTEILAYLEQNNAAPQSAKPMATLQSTLQRLKELGEIENTGRNRWRLRAAESAPAAPAAPRPAPGPPVVTSTTRFGARPGAGL